MVEILGQKVYEELPAYTVDLDKVTVSTFQGDVDGIDEGVVQVDELIAMLSTVERRGVTPDGIPWSITGGIIPDIIIDVENDKVTEAHLVSLIKAGVIPA